MKLSFIIPAYNSAKYITTAIQSIYNLQLNGNDFEIIVINDGSSDNTEDILKSFSNRYNNFHYVSQNNSGAAMARNLGISLAKGEYVQFVDSDDFLNAKDYNYLTDALFNEQLDIIAFNKIDFKDYIECNGNVENCRNAFSSNSEKCLTGEQYILNNLFQSSPVLYIYRRKFLIDNNLIFRNTRSCEDIDSTLKWILAANRIRFVNKYIYIINEREGSLSRTINFEFEANLLNAILEGAKVLETEKCINNPLLSQRISEYLICPLLIQEHHLYNLRLLEIFKFCSRMKGISRRIKNSLIFSHKFKKQERYLTLLATSSVSCTCYLMIKKLYLNVNSKMKS